MLVSFDRSVLQKAFALPAVIITSVVMLIVLLAALQSVTSISQSLSAIHHDRLAREAAESGLIYAVDCLRTTGTPQWTSSAPLRPGSSCSGSQAETAKPYVLNTPQLKTSFVVTQVPTVNSVGMWSIKATGYVSLRRASNQAVEWKKIKYETASQVVVSPRFQQVSGNDYHTCAQASGRVYCWGDNTYGQLGTNTTSTTSTTTPAEIVYAPSTGLRPGTVTSIGTGNLYTCALAAYKVYCWGDNTYGQLGQGNTTDSSVPLVVTGGALSGKYITQLSVGANNVCVVAQDSTSANDSTRRAYCWGWNPDGQLGDNSITDRSLPVAVYTGSGSALTSTIVTQVDTQDYHTCAVTTTGAVSCWGRNASGQLGVGSTYAYTAVPKSAIASNVSKVGVGSHHTCVLASARVYCWGFNAYGQLGYGDTTNRSQHGGAISGSMGTNSVTALDVGDYHNCGVVAGKLHCWGRNADGPGQLGDNSATNRLSPGAVLTASPSALPASATVVDVGANDFNTCAATSTGAAYCWGRNNYGQLGDGTTTNRAYPVIFDTTRLKPIYLNY